MKNYQSTYLYIFFFVWLFLRTHNSWKLLDVGSVHINHENFLSEHPLAANSWDECLKLMRSHLCCSIQKPWVVSSRHGKDTDPDLHCSPKTDCHRRQLRGSYAELPQDFAACALRSLTPKIFASSAIRSYAVLLQSRRWNWFRRLAAKCHTKHQTWSKTLEKVSKISPIK